MDRQERARPVHAARPARRRVQGDHRAAAAGRPPVVRGDRARRSGCPRRPCGSACSGCSTPGSCRSSPSPIRCSSASPAGHDRHQRRRRHRRPSPTSWPRSPRSTTSSSPPAPSTSCVEVVCEDDEHLLALLNDSHPLGPGVRDTETFVYLRLASRPTPGEPDDHHTAGRTRSDDTSGCDRARRHLWMHFTRMSTYADHEVPMIVRGEGPYVWDAQGKRYLDGLAGLFVVAGRPRPHRARPGGGASRRRSSRTSRCGRTRTRRRSSSPSGSPAMPRETSTGSSSPPAAARRSRAPGSSPGSTSS